MDKMEDLINFMLTCMDKVYCMMHKIANVII